MDEKPRAPRQAGTGRFLPGASPNPGGRPKKIKEVIDAAQVHTKEAIRVLAKIMRDKNAKEADRIKACNSLLERGWGTPVKAADPVGDEAKKVIHIRFDGRDEDEQEKEDGQGEQAETDSDPEG